MSLLSFGKDASRMRLSAEEAADAVGAMRQQLPVRIDRFGESVSGPGGTALSIEDQRFYVDYRVGKIVSRPEDSSPGTDDYTDERYYVICQNTPMGEAADRLKLDTAVNDYPDDNTLTVTNLAEWVDGGGTHTLPTDGTRYVMVFAWADANGIERYVMDVPAGTDLCTIDSAITLMDDTPTGFYNGTLYHGGIDYSAGTSPHLVTVGPCIVWNLEEQTTRTSWLLLGQSLVCSVLGKDDAGLPFVAVPTGSARTASPAEVGTGDAGDETADPATWKRDRQLTAGTDYGNTPVKIWQQSRANYFSDSDQVLYGFLRPYTYDASGQLYEIGAEVRYVIDTPTDCPPE